MANPGYTRIVGVALGTTYNFPATIDLQNRMIERCVLTCDTSGGPITINMPAIADLGGFLNLEVVIVDVGNNASVNNITVNASGTDLINSAANNIINTNRAIVTYKIASVDSPDMWTATLSNLTPAATPFLTNLVYVDAVNGNDATGLPYRIDKPFQTITAAQAVAAANGDTVYVYPGSYVETNLGTDGVTYWFCPGASVSGAGTIFQALNGEIYRVYGSGVFKSTVGNAIDLDNGAVINLECDSIQAGAVLGGQGINVDGGSTLFARITGNVVGAGILSSGNGIVINETVVGSGTTAYIECTSITANATAFATVAPASDTCVAECHVSGTITTINAAIDAFCINIVGGRVVTSGTCVKRQAGGGAAAILLHPAAGISARLRHTGDVICPKTGINVQLSAGIAVIYGNLNNGNIALGGGVMKVTGGSGIHEFYGQMTCDTNDFAIQVSGGKLYHDGRNVNTSPGAGGYSFGVDKALILRGGNSIVTSAGTSISDAGGGLTVLLYGEVVANTAAAGTVVAGVGTLTVDGNVV